MSDKIEDVDVTDFSHNYSESLSSSSHAAVSSTPATSISRSSSKSKSLSSIPETIPLLLNPAVTVSFVKGSQLFKLKYTQINISKDALGGLRGIDFRGVPGDYSGFVHNFPRSRLPIPHVEHPYESNSAPPFVVSFLEEQTVTVAQVLFNAQPHYSFENWNDCIRFQETVLDHRIIFVAGISEAKSKGRGEECISQNLRVIEARNGGMTIFFFANSQRRDKRYVSVPVEQIDNVDKKSGKRVLLKLSSSSELLAQMKTLQIEFLDVADKVNFMNIVLRRPSVS